MADIHRRALLVACTRYEDPKLRDLRAPEADVAELTRVLGDPRVGNFEVQPALLDAPKDEVEGQIEGFFEGAGSGDLLLLYLSGHGVVSKSRQWFFATPNTKVGRLGSTAVSDTYIRERMKGSRSPAIVLVLDCCHSGAFARSLLAKGGEDIHVEHHFEGRGRVALTASTEFEWALEGERGPDRDRPLSVFTELLVEGLSSGDADLDGDGQISISELYNYVAGRMPARSPGQTPGKAGDVIGEIVIASGRRKPVLPADVRQALLSSFPEFRRAAIGPLMRLRSGAEPDAAHAIDDALARLTLDDDPEVATAARAAQGVPAPLTIDLAHLPDIREDLLPPPPALRTGQAGMGGGPPARARRRPDRRGGRLPALGRAGQRDGAVRRRARAPQALRPRARNRGPRPARREGPDRGSEARPRPPGRRRPATGARRGAARLGGRGARAGAPGRPRGGRGGLSRGGRCG